MSAFALSPSALESATAHALRDYPSESCGVVVQGRYVPLRNYAIDPASDFVIAAADWKRFFDKGLTIEAVVHSHPDGPLFPTESDMQGQLQTDVPWVILATDGEQVAPPIVWGEGVDHGPLIGRTFRHGVTDCWELVRDTYRAGREELARQGVTDKWLLDPVELIAWPRADGWWNPEVEATSRNIYAEGFTKAGFRPIMASEAVPGDCFVLKLGHKIVTPNHGGVFLGDDLILHHLPTRASRREPIGIWLRAIEQWYRHEALDRVLENA